MNFGYKLLLIGFIIGIAGFILSEEYPNRVTEGIFTISATGSLIIVVIGSLFAFKSRSTRNICQNCGQKIDTYSKYCPKCGNKI